MSTHTRDNEIDIWQPHLHHSVAGAREMRVPSPPPPGRYKCIANREQFHMAARGWGQGAYWNGVPPPMRATCERAYGLMEAVAQASLAACCPDAAQLMARQATACGPVGLGERRQDASVLDAFRST